MRFLSKQGQPQPRFQSKHTTVKWPIIPRKFVEQTYNRKNRVQVGKSNNRKNRIIGRIGESCASRKIGESEQSYNRKNRVQVGKSENRNNRISKLVFCYSPI